jgi:GNAT superfamily N-acetyltransferase
MHKILSDLSRHAIVDALRQNFYDVCWELRHYWKQAVFEETEKQRRWRTSMPMAFIFNAAVSRQPPAANETEHIHETIQFFRSKGRASFSWWLAPGLEESDWRDQLEAHGFRFETGPPGMAVDLKTIPEWVPVPEGYQIQQIENTEGMQIWLKTFLRGYDFSSDWEAPSLDFMLATLSDPNGMSYLAFVHDQPVAVSTVLYRAGVAGIFSVATLQEWRGKGLGAAVTLQPLLDARAKSYRVGTLQSSDMGYKVYQRLGFKEVCRMNHYDWQTPE